MKVTEVRIFRKENADKKLKAFATITFDDIFVVRDIKVIEGNKGLFVAMPSRRMKEACPRCGHGNVLRSRFCNQCGANIEGVTTHGLKAGKGETQGEHRDIAHPITLECRETIQKAVLDAYEKDLARSGEPGSTRPQPSPKSEKTQAFDSPKATDLGDEYID